MQSPCRKRIFLHKSLQISNQILPVFVSVIIVVVVEVVVEVVVVVVVSVSVVVVGEGEGVVVGEGVGVIAEDVQVTVIGATDPGLLYDDPYL